MSAILVALKSLPWSALIGYWYFIAIAGASVAALHQRSAKVDAYQALRKICQPMYVTTFRPGWDSHTQSCATAVRSIELGKRELSDANAGNVQTIAELTEANAQWSAWADEHNADRDAERAANERRIAALRTEIQRGRNDVTQDPETVEWDSQPMPDSVGDWLHAITSRAADSADRDGNGGSARPGMPYAADHD